MFEVIIWGFGLRFVQCLAQASPFILTGLFITAIFRRLLGYEGTRRLFGADTKRSLIQAWGVGMLLPVCSLGAIPIARELKKVGLTGGTILAFAMSAPLFNPLSLLYGLTLSEPVVILTFAACSLLIVTLVGAMWDRFFRKTGEAAEPPKTVAYGIKRMLAIGVTAAREAAGPTLGYLAIGLIGVALLGAFLPLGILQKKMNYDNQLAPLLMTALAIPVYATPMLAMSQLGTMFQHGNSVGAAFVLLILGAGMNLGLLVWMLRAYGLKRSLAWFALLLVVVVGLAYGVDKPLYPAGVDPADHTHAFDVYCRPYQPGSVPSVPTATFNKLTRDVHPYEWYALSVFLAVALSGAMLNLVDRKGRIEQWLEREQTADSATSKYDVVIPGPVLGGVALVGLIVISGVGCYAYYPDPNETLEEMQIVHAEALSAAISGDFNHSCYWIERFDDWSRRLEVGTYLRDWQLSDYHRMKGQLLRQNLELLEHEIRDQDREAAGKLAIATSISFTRLRRAYRDDR